MLKTIILGPFILMFAIFGEGWRIWRIMLAFYKNMLKKKSNTHGDAEFAGVKQLKGRGHYKAGGWLVGIHGGKRLYTSSESSALTMAPKGSGKTQTAIAQLREIATRQSKPDVVVFDPAGDIRAGTREWYESRGYRVIQYDFVNPRESDFYDPLTYPKAHDVFNFDRQVAQMCRLILPDDRHSREDHFQDFARLLVAGTLSFLMVERKGDATLYNAVHYLTANKHQRNRMFAEMEKCSSPLAQQAVNAFSEAGDKERGSFSTTLARKLNVWLRQGVRHLTESGEITADGNRERGISWEDIYLGDQPTIVYIVSGLGTGEGEVARLILGNAINTRRALWNVMRKKPARDLRILVDESREIGNCEAIMDANNELRKAGVTVMMYWLSMTDLMDTYPQAKTLVNNSDLIVFGGGKDMTFYEDVSRLAGEKTIENPGYSESEHGYSESRSEQGQRLVKADALRRMPYEDEVVILDNMAVKARKPFRRKPGGVEYL